MDLKTAPLPTTGLMAHAIKADLGILVSRLLLLRHDVLHLSHEDTEGHGVESVQTVAGQ
jgi:hypothetical protein